MKITLMITSFIISTLLLTGCSSKQRTMNVKSKINLNLSPTKELKLQVGDVSVEAVSLGAWWIVYYVAVPVKAYSKISRQIIGKEIVTSELNSNHKNIKAVDNNADYILDVEFESMEDSDYSFITFITLKDPETEQIVFEKEYIAYPSYRTDDSDKLLKSVFSNAIKQFIYDKEALVAMNGFDLNNDKVALNNQKNDNNNRKYKNDDIQDLLDSYPNPKVDSSKWLFVIGIEQYEYTNNILFAKHSAEMFVDTIKQVQGVPNKNTYVLIDQRATQARIKTSLKKMLRRIKTGDTIYFYYNGHGVPVPHENNTPYILTHDTEPDFVQDEKFFSLENIYTMLSNSNAGKVVAVIDSCFSGVTDGEAILKGVAATKLVAKHATFNKDKMVVLSAGRSHQYSNAYNEKQHRLFSYYIIKNMLAGEKEIKTIYKNTKTQTYQTSIEEYGDLRTQEPTIEGNARMEL